MNRKLLSALVASGAAFPMLADTPSPAPPCDIVWTVSHFTIPRLNFRETTLEEALAFIHRKYEDVLGDPRPTDFVFDVRLSEATLQRHVSFQAEDVTMIEALQRALADVPVALTFEPGKVIFTPLSSQTNAPSPK